MASSKTDMVRNRLARATLAVALAVVAIGSLRQGKRLRGALAGAGALALGYNVTSESGELSEAVDTGAAEEGIGTDTTDASGKLRCAACGRPIRPGQSRGPNANDEIVHDACNASLD